MIHELLGLAPGDDKDLPPEDAPDLVLVRWLNSRLGRQPIWMEVLELRFLLRALAWRRARWRWWRRPRPLRRPGRDDLVADFLSSGEGQLLLRAVGGGIAALVARLERPDPFEGLDGSHPTATRPTRRERLRERIAIGAPVPLWSQAGAVTAYATWKVTGVPVLAPGLVPEMVEFLAPDHAAAVNVMAPSAVMEFARRLSPARCSDAGRRIVLAELSRIGTEAMTSWLGAARASETPPLGLWPESPAADCVETAGRVQESLSDVHSSGLRT
jgi:hypothetical protein